MLIATYYFSCGHSNGSELINDVAWECPNCRNKKKYIFRKLATHFAMDSGLIEIVITAIISNRDYPLARDTRRPIWEKWIDFCRSEDWS